MKVRYFLIADYAASDASGKMNIIGIFTQIYCKDFPITHDSMFIATEIVFEYEDSDKPFQFAIQVINEDGSILNDLTTPVNVPSRKIQFGKRSTYAFVTKIRNVTMEGRGNYEFQLTYQGDIIASTPLDVVHRPN